MDAQDKMELETTAKCYSQTGDCINHGMCNANDGCVYAPRQHEVKKDKTMKNKNDKTTQNVQFLNELKAKLEKYQMLELFAKSVVENWPKMTIRTISKFNADVVGLAEALKEVNK